MVNHKTLNEIKKEGTYALVKALEPIGMVRFPQSFDIGSGDYTKERREWLDESVEDIMRKIRKVDK